MNPSFGRDIDGRFTSLDGIYLKSRPSCLPLGLLFGARSQQENPSAKSPAWRKALTRIHEINNHSKFHLFIFNNTNFKAFFIALIQHSASFIFKCNSL